MWELVWCLPQSWEATLTQKDKPCRRKQTKLSRTSFSEKVYFTVFLSAREMRDAYERKLLSNTSKWCGCTITKPQTCYTNSVFSSHPSLSAPCGSTNVCSAVWHTRLQHWFMEKNCWGIKRKKRLTNLLIRFLSLMNMNVSADTRREIKQAWEQDWMRSFGRQRCVWN